MITGRTDRQTDRQRDRQTDRVRRNMRPPPREEGRIIMLADFTVVNFCGFLWIFERWTWIFQKDITATLLISGECFAETGIQNGSGCC